MTELIKTPTGQKLTFSTLGSEGDYAALLKVCVKALSCDCLNKDDRETMASFIADILPLENQLKLSKNGKK